MNSLLQQIAPLPPAQKVEAIARAIDAGRDKPRSLNEETDLLELADLAGTEEKELALAEKIARVLGHKRAVIKPMPNKGRMIRRIHWKEYLEALEARAERE